MFQPCCWGLRSQLVRYAHYKLQAAFSRHSKHPVVAKQDFGSLAGQLIADPVWQCSVRIDRRHPPGNGQGINDPHFLCRERFVQLLSVAALQAQPVPDPFMRWTGNTLRIPV